MNINENYSALEVDDNDAHVGYWAAAAVWFDAWEQKTIDRVSYFPVLLLHASVDIHICRSVSIVTSNLIPHKRSWKLGFIFSCHTK